MTPELWRRVSSVLDQVLELPQGERARFIQDLRPKSPDICTEVESLLGQLPNPLLDSLPQSLFEDFETSKVGFACADTILHVTQSASDESWLTSLRSAGHYLIQEEIARGGMGAILRVHDPTFGRILAIKVLLPKSRIDANAERRFLQEAQITGCLQHPGIPPIHELGQLTDGTPFFAMKLIEGNTLTKLITESGATTMDARFVGIFEQICRTLAYAHSKGILHRDLKPSNVMVGAFGEVQVMDWGLAKPITGHESDAQFPHGNAGDALHLIGSFSVVGDVMGTPAYMAPEQARGEVDLLDERCDVFGLGGILYAMLIGRAPFFGSVAHMVRQSADGDLREAFGLLDRCNADPGIVVIAKKCLAPLSADRYRNGTEVADAITRHRESVQERLAEAELASARAQVQAREERRRRRLAIAFSVVVLLMVVAGGSAGLWYQAERQRLAQEQTQRVAEEEQRKAASETTRQKVSLEVTAALDSAEGSRRDYQRQLSDPTQTAKLISDINLWQAMLSDCDHAWKRANAAAAGNKSLIAPSLVERVDQIGAGLQADQREFNRAKRLDEIRLGDAVRVGGWFDYSQTGVLYADFFQEELGLNFERDDPQQVAASILKSPIRFALVASLDHWALSRESDPKLLAQLLEVARLADPDPSRNQLRDQELWRDSQGFLKLVESMDTAYQPPPFLAALADRLETVGDSVPMLRLSLIHHPRDFWLNVKLGLNFSRSAPEAESNPGEAAGYLQAALAVRPESPVVYAAMGNALARHQDHAGAAASYRQAVQLDPRFADAYCNLGISLLVQKDYPGAAEAFQKAMNTLDYKNDLLVAWISYNLASALENQGQASEAAAALLRALDNVSNSRAPLADKIRSNVGNALERLGRVDDAITAYEKSTRLDPKPAQAYFMWGKLLMAHEDSAGAVPILQKAITKMEAKDDRLAGFSYFYLGAAHYRHKNYEGALAAYRKAEQFNPSMPDTHYEVGKTLLALGDLEGAELAFRQGISKLKGTDNKMTQSLDFELGKTLELLGKFDDALALWKERQHQPNWRDSQGTALKDCERLIEFDARVTAVLKDGIDITDANELTKLAEHCLVYRKMPATAVRFYEKAFALDPKLISQLRYQAATAAVLAASSQGKEVSSLAETEKSKLRKQSHTWLSEQLTHALSPLQLKPPVSRVRGEMRQWEQDPNLAAIRSPQALANLPADELQAWQDLWTQVADHGPGILSPATWESEHLKQGRSFWHDYAVSLLVEKGKQAQATVWNTKDVQGDFEAEAYFHLKSMKANPEEYMYLRFLASSQPRDLAPQLVMIERFFRFNREEIVGYAYSGAGWETGHFVPYEKLYGKLRIRRRGNEWKTEFQVNDEDQWIPVGNFQTKMPTAVYLGLSVGTYTEIEGESPLEVVISRVTLTKHKK